MLKCLLLKRKLYDYLENCLSDLDMGKVEGHLKTCNKCRQSLSRIKNILDLASQNQTPQPNVEFWHNFKIDLDRKLNARLVPEIKLERRLSYRLRPVFAYATILIFMLFAGGYFYKNSPSALRYTEENTDLVDDTELLDELDEEANLNHSEDAYLDEINLLYQLDVDLT